METTKKTGDDRVAESARLIDVACGHGKADLVLKNADYVNVFSGEICHGDIALCGSRIAGIGTYEGLSEIDCRGMTVTPGLIDAHIHLESSLLLPEEFARAVLAHGTTTLITDPHEIANVLGTDGVRYMLEATENLPLDVLFMLPSCVPATPLDESGALLTAENCEPLYEEPRVIGLAEMMNYVGVVQQDGEVLKKIVSAKKRGKPIDGHAPGLSGKDLCGYIASGVYSDHECDNYDNALEKLRLGQHIMIREGTAAKNLKALAPLLQGNGRGRCMFATDDKHPNDLLNGGHIDHIVREAVLLGVDEISAVTAATLNPASYFSLSGKGAVAPGYFADLVIVDNLHDFHVTTVIKNGSIVCNHGEIAAFSSPVSPELSAKACHSIHMKDTVPADFACGKGAVIGIIPGEIVTENGGEADAVDVAGDILKIAVAERHHDTGHIGIGYLHGYGLREGAVATSVNHDSHNIIAVGTNDADISFAVNYIKEIGGGIAVINRGRVTAALPLPIAGIMSDLPLADVNARLEQAKAEAYRLGVTPAIDPFMTLSFMGLPVIPKLKITTHGVFDVEHWTML